MLHTRKNKSCGYAMSKYLPTGGFKCWIPRNLAWINMMITVPKVAEVDLDYPKELDALHNDYPLAPDKLEIKNEMFFDYQLKIAGEYNVSIGNDKKLVSNFFDKKQSALHYKNLQL